METFFLVCFIFGALLTLMSALLGFADLGLDLGHDGGIGPHGHDVTVGHDAQAGDAGTGHGPLPILNVSSLLAFLTWFGATGYLLLRFAGWPLLGAVAVAVGVGVIGAVLIARFLAAIMASERVMDPRDYALEGTLARVTVSIPAGGVGEIVFTKANARRSEAARSVDNRAVPRGTEVVILEYERGIATVQPWNELLTGEEPGALEEPASPHESTS